MSESDSQLSLSSAEYDRRRKIWEIIKTLTKSEQEELYRILKRGNVETTENTNGIFFDVGKLPQPLIEQISKFLEFCSQNRRNFEERDVVLATLRGDS
jgi:hypothetical protein